MVARMARGMGGREQDEAELRKNTADQGICSEHIEKPCRIHVQKDE